jgi:ribokinase
MPPKITVVGSFAVGLTMNVPRLPVRGETLLGSGFAIGPGGKGSNQAVGAARLGALSRFVAMIGVDNFGDIAVEMYRREGVDITHLRRTSERPTGVGFIIVGPSGENMITVDVGANLLLSPAEVDAAEALIADSDVVLSVLEIPVAPAARAAALARRHGVRMILNPAPAQPLDDDFLRNIDILTPNEGELRVIAGLAPDDPADGVEIARSLIARGVGAVMITRGGEGVTIVARDAEAVHVPAFPVQPVDTTGAGDSFNSALAVALAEGKDLAVAARFAAAAGAFTVTRPGVIPALPTRAELEAFIEAARR